MCYSKSMTQEVDHIEIILTNLPLRGDSIQEMIVDCIIKLSKFNKKSYVHTNLYFPATLKTLA